MKKGLLATVILLYFSGCEEATDIGLQLQESEVFGGTTFTDTVSVRTSVVLLDSIVTSSTSRTLVGKMDDDKFGDLTSRGYFQVILPSEDSALVFGTNQAVFDSVVLQIPNTGAFGDANTTLNYEVFELTERVDSVDYLRTDTLGFAPVPLGSIAYNPDEDDSNLFRVRLDDAFGQKIFERSGQTVLQDQDQFDALVGGVLIAPTSTAEGHVMLLQPRTVGTVSYLRIYYSEPGDTVSSFRTLGFGNVFHNIQLDFTGTALEGLELGGEVPTTELGDEAYLQMGVGLTTKIEFPYLASLGQGSNLAVNRAELVMDPINGSIDDYGIPPSTLIFLIEDEEVLSTSPNAVVEGVGSSALASIDYISGGRSYENARLTTYIQSVIDGEAENFGLFLGHAEPVLDAFGRNIGSRPRLSNNTSLQKLLFADANNLNTQQLKLEIYLTTF